MIFKFKTKDEFDNFNSIMILIQGKNLILKTYDNTNERNRIYCKELKFENGLLVDQSSTKGLEDFKHIDVTNFIGKFFALQKVPS